ncbi:MAG: hypothetical protein K8S13_24430 [Desulfobacula sp.]|uniref:hypothetical protein n=1 Tax=Desulfobacula sp. TaxID=2593537 RepID=UPI0025BC769B|nr:hypothetical protein [Desulfobacula sp.]MCD4722977.1 hypothetical protein [Desulfobacula sp.]
MQLLDASLAFVLTLAALATVVTTIMEACFRIARMRKKNLIEVMKLLNKELGKGSLKMNPKERWEFFSKVVENPAEAVDLVSKTGWQKSDSDEGKEKDLTDFLSSFGKRGDRKGIYDKVTLEYVLRCLSEIASVKRASLEASDMLKTELNRIARKYEEFGSAVSASFKQNAQAWSIGIGIVLALAANVDGIRIFEAYRADPKLADTVIEKQEGFIEKNQEVRAAIKTLNELYSRKSVKENEIDTAEKAKKDLDEINRLKTELKEIQNNISEQSEIAAIQKTIQDAKNQVSELRALGVPIGWDFYPNCPFGKDETELLKACPDCKDIILENKDIKCEGFGARLLSTLTHDFTGFMVWLMKVIITGILIGLGAPFWFDVAKRLSQIRRGLKNPNSSAEDRLAARDANGDADERKKIVEDVVSDTIMEATASAFEQPSKLLGPKRIIL